MRSTVKEFIEALMKGKIQAFPDQHDGQRKGYYERDLGIRYGKINDLKVPRDGDNEFQTATFDGYRRNAWIDYLVVSMYGKGISTMKMAEILEVHAKAESLILFLTAVRCVTRKYLFLVRSPSIFLYPHIEDRIREHILIY